MTKRTKERLLKYILYTSLHQLTSPRLTIYDSNLDNTKLTKQQATTCRELKPSLAFQLLLEGSYNPLSSCTSRYTST